MKTFFLLSSLALISATAAFAGGVERQFVLPADAKNFKVMAAEVSEYAVSSKTVWDNGDSPTITFTYAKKLWVKVDFDSSDDTFAPQNWPDGGPTAWDDASPTIETFITIPQAQIAAIEAGKVDALSLVSQKVAVEPITMEDPSYENQCRYDNDSNQKIDDGCEEHIPNVVVNLPVLTVTVAQ